MKKAFAILAIFILFAFSAKSQHNFGFGFYFSGGISPKISESKQDKTNNYQYYKPSFFSGLRTETKLNKNKYLRAGLEFGYENIIANQAIFIKNEFLEIAFQPAEKHYKKLTISVPVYLVNKFCSGNDKFRFYTGYGLNPQIYKKDFIESIEYFDNNGNKQSVKKIDLQRFNEKRKFNIENLLNVSAFFGYERRLSLNYATQIEFMPEFRPANLVFSKTDLRLSNKLVSSPFIFRLNVSIMRF